jgi:hypothetical protein
VTLLTFLFLPFSSLTASPSDSSTSDAFAFPLPFAAGAALVLDLGAGMASSSPSSSESDGMGALFFESAGMGADGGGREEGNETAMIDRAGERHERANNGQPVCLMKRKKE